MKYLKNDSKKKTQSMKRPYMKSIFFSAEIVEKREEKKTTRNSNSNKIKRSHRANEVYTL